MARFRLVPLEQESAMEQLWRAARQATLHVLKTYRFYGLQGQWRQTLIEDVMLQAVRHFLQFKIGQKKYNRNFCFMNNVMSSVWGVQNAIADKLIKEMIALNHSTEIGEVAFRLGPQDAFPLYLSKGETFHRKNNGLPFDEKRPCDRARIARELYEDYLMECDELGITNKLELGPWLVRNGYGDDSELFLQLEPKEVRKSMRYEQRKMEREKGLTPSQLNRREYQRNWQKAYREKHPKDTLAEEYEQLYGPPPAGWEYYNYRDIVAIRRIRRK
jgi:hypothetical protein